MNWKPYQVTDKDLLNLINYNEPITVAGGVLGSNSGVEVFSLGGKVFNAVYDANMGAIRKMNLNNPVFSSFQNRDLQLYNDHLLNPAVNTLIVDGFFGTGKTSSICSHLVPGLMAGMKGGQGGITSAYISKPHVPHGNSYGHLPGDLEDKAQYEFQSYFQYFDRFGQPFLADVLMGKKEVNGKPIVPMLHMVVFEYIRGRDIENGWIVLDEAQNTDTKEMATFISRPTDNTKVIIIGDTTPTQIDRRGNTEERNGLTFAKQTYFGTKYTGVVELQTINHIVRGKRVRDLFLALKKGA